MVILCRSRHEHGALMTELVVAMAILTVAVLPLSLTFLDDVKMCRTYYYRTLALEIIDGEMETLLAGEGKAFNLGAQSYTVRAESATNLPPGRFQLTRSDSSYRLEWIPQHRGSGGTVVREVPLKPQAQPKGGGK